VFWNLEENNMKASVMHQYGGPEVLNLEEYPDPIPAEGEVLVRVSAASINPVDNMQRAGLTREYLPVAFPGVIGWDLSGTVVQLGPGAEDFALGDRVFGWAFHTFAELCAVKTELLAKVPEGLNLVDSAALPLVGTTGSQLISAASGVEKGQTILVAGANGGVGRSAVFTAKDRGAYVIAGVTSSQVEQAQALGVERIVALDDWEQLRSLPLVDVVANMVRGKTADLLMEKVKAGGTFASATGAPTNANRFPSVRIVEFVSKQNARTLDYIANAARDGKLSIPVDRRIPLSEASAGMTAVEKGGIGKVLLLP
jgi:NADPH:quinone reductase-like Zn-dependent oxidoreductase